MAENKDILKHKKKKKRKKVIFTSASVLIALLLFALVLILANGSKIIKNFITNTVSYQSGGMYEVEIGEIETNWLELGFEVKNFHLIPNNDIYRQKRDKGEVETGLYDVKVPEFKVKGILPGLAFYDNIFVIEELEIDDPELKLVDIPIFSKKEKYESGYDDIRPIIIRLVEFFKVENLRINDGIFDIFLEKEGQRKSFTAAKISLQLKNFQIDNKGITEDGKFLYSEGGQVLFKDYKINLNDGIHVIEANEIGINTLDSLLFAKGLSLNPKQINPDSLKKTESSYINAFFPEIIIKGTDIVQAYENDTFDIQFLKILRPKIKFSNQKPLDKRVRSDKSLPNQFNFYPLISGYFKLVDVDSFKIEQGNFQYNEPKEGVPENIKIKGIDVGLYQIKLDSNAYREKSKILYSSNVELDFNSFELSLRDSIHKLEAKSLLVSSKNKSLKATGLKIYPIRKPEGREKDLLTIDLPEIDIINFDLFEMYLNGNLTADVLKVQNPHVKLEDVFRKRINEKEKKSASDIYSLFARYLRSAKFDRITLNDGTIHYIQNFKDKNEEIFADQISIELFKFYFDSIRFVNKEQILFSEHVDFQLNDYDFILPNELNEIEVGTFKFSSRNKSMHLKDIKMRLVDDLNVLNILNRHQKTGYIEFDIPEITISEAEIIRALNTRYIDIGNVTIKKPLIKRYNFPELNFIKSLPPEIVEIRKLVNNVFPSLRVGNLQVQEAVLKSINSENNLEKLIFRNDFKLKITNIEIAPDSLEENRNRKFFFSERIIATFFKQELSLNDGIHHIKTDSVILNYPLNSLDAFGFRIVADSNLLSNYKKSVFFNASSPLVHFKGVEMINFYDDQTLVIDTALIDSIDIQIVQNKFYTKSDSIYKNVFKMPLILNDLNIKRFEIKKGQLDFLDTLGRRFADATFLGTVEHSIIDETSIGPNVKKLPFRNLDLSFPEIKFEIYPIDHKVNIRDLRINTLDSVISTGEIVFSPKNPNNSISYKKWHMLNLDSIKVSGLNYDNIYLKDEIDARSIEFFSPVYSSMLDTINQSKTEINALNIYPSIRDNIKKIEIDNISIDKGEFKSFINKDDSLVELRSLENIFVYMDSILVDEYFHQDDDRLLYSKDIRLVLKNYSRSLQDNMLKLKFEELGISTGKDQIFANGVKLEPQFNEYDYSRELGYQSDRVEFYIPRLELNDVDLLRLYNHRELDAGSLEIDSLNLLDFRDKRVPNRLGFYPPMPHEILRQAPIKIYIDSVFLREAYANYREFAPDGEDAGEIYFSNINSKIYQVSNDSGYYFGNPNTFLFAIGKLMGEGDIIMSANFNLLDTSNTFSIRGSMGSIDMTKVNPMLENVAFVSVKSGTARSINFSFDADDDYARGNLNFKYNKFKIFVINRKTGEAEGLDEGIVSWLANTFLINTRNPHLGFFKEGEIFFRRDKNKSIVNYVWKSIFSGIKTSIGAQTQKKLHKIAEKEEKAENK